MERSFEYLGSGREVGRLGSIPVMQQALLPKLSDPKLFRIRCKVGMEQVIVRSIMLKTVDMYQKGTDKIMKIKSVFCGDIKGFVYVEAIKEVFAKEILDGLRSVYANTFAMVPLAEMPTALAVTVKKKPLQAEQWVRIKRGILKNDLARVIHVMEGGSKALIQAVPRPDYNAPAAGEKKASILGGKSKVRPPQRLFEPEKTNGQTLRRYFSEIEHVIREPFDVWEGEHYRHGFLYKVVNVDTTLSTDNVNPKLEELQTFVNHVKQADQNRNTELYAEGDEDGPGTSHTEAANTSLRAELEQQIKSMEAEDEIFSTLFIPGDCAKVIGGELRGLIVRIMSVNDISKTAQVKALNNSISEEFEIEWSALVKYVAVGAHIKVMKGKYMGQTGRVVSVVNEGEEQIAVILTDVTNNEIMCNVSYLKMSNETSSGLANLQGYELYDLVKLSENESAVIINILIDKLRVINHLENVKEVAPQEIRGKQNIFSNRLRATDLHQNQITCGDVVHVVEGKYVNHSGTVKHIMHGTLWLHSNTFLKNSGIFVVKSRNCTLAGSQSMPAPVNTNVTKGSFSQPSPQSSIVSTPTSIGSSRGFGGRGGKDPLMGLSVRITRGQFKGMLGRVSNCTPTHVSVELHAKLKKVTVERSAVVEVTAQGQSNYVPGHVGGDIVVPSTPYLTAETPIHMAGSQTPSAGSETPWAGGMTPYGQSSSVWRIGSEDLATSEIPSRMTTPQVSEYGDSTPYGNYETSTTTTATAPSSDNIEFYEGMVVIVRKGVKSGQVAVVTKASNEVSILSIYPVIILVTLFCYLALYLSYSFPRWTRSSDKRRY
jgi:transcription elongation factor SPT5